MCGIVPVETKPPMSTIACQRPEMIRTRELRVKYTLVKPGPTIKSGVFIKNLYVLSHNRIKMLLVKVFNVIGIKKKNNTMHPCWKKMCTASTSPLPLAGAMSTWKPLEYLQLNFLRQ